MVFKLLSQFKDESCSFFGEQGVIATRIGLVKAVNEDAIGFRIDDSGCVRMSIADGHWGQEAAKHCVEYWLNSPTDNDSLESMEELQDGIAKRFAVPVPDAETTRTPEASTLTITVHPDRRMDVVGYGDCRLSVVRDERILYRYDTVATWLGLFSSIGLRDRIPARSGTYAGSVQLAQGDVVLLYTDGVDECIYEKPTLDVESFAKASATAVQIHDKVMNAVFRHGAEDNATLAVYRV